MCAFVIEPPIGTDTPVVTAPGTGGGAPITSGATGGTGYTPTRAISPAMLALLAGGSPQLAVCLLLTRTDGVVLGLTGWQQGFTFQAVIYTPNSAITASAVRQNADISADDSETDGLLLSGAIAESDVRAGLWDNATYQLFLVNPNELSIGPIIVQAGRVGVQTLNDGTWKFQLMSWKTLLKQNVQIAASQTCRVKVLGDYQCKLNMAGRSHTVTLSALSSDWLTLTTNDTQASGYYVYGIALGQSGENLNIQRQIASNADGVIVLREPFPFQVNDGDTLILTQGCDRNFSTCQALGNVINFHGEPFVPGNDNALQIGDAS